MSISLLISRAYQYSNAGAYVFSDSVLCLGEMGDDLVESWKRQIQWYPENNHFKEMNRIDGTPPEVTTLGLFEKIQSLVRDLQCEPEHFKSMIIFMSMFNDIVWDAKGNKEQCAHNSQTVADYVRKFPRGHWSFLGSGSEEMWYGTYTGRSDGSWDNC